MAAITFIERINKDALVMTGEHDDDYEDYEEKIREMGEFIEYKSPKIESTFMENPSLSLPSGAIRHDDKHDYISSLDEDDRSDYHRHHLANNESDDDILEEGKRVFHKIKSSRVVSKSIGYLKEMMTKAEEAINDALKEAISDDINMSARGNDIDKTKRTRNRNRNKYKYNNDNDKNDNGNDEKQQRQEEEEEEESEEEEQAMRLKRIEEEKEEEEEFQLQLAMALSLSEHQYHSQGQKQQSLYHHQEQEQQKRDQKITKEKDENNSAMKKRSLSI